MSDSQVRADVFDRWLTRPPSDLRTLEEFADAESVGKLVPVGGYKLWCEPFSGPQYSTHLPPTIIESFPAPAVLSASEPRICDCCREPMAMQPSSSHPDRIPCEVCVLLDEMPDE